MIKSVLLCFILLFGVNNLPGTIYAEVEEVTTRRMSLPQHNENQQSNPLQSVTEDAIQWMRTYGGNGEDSAWSVIQATDGGYALCGSSGAQSNYTAWLMKTDTQGNTQWTQTYNFSRARAVIPTTDGGYALAGTWEDVIRDDSDAWLVKTNAQGVVQWNNVHNVAIQDIAQAVIQTSDGGFVLGGYSYGDMGNSDAWLVKYDGNGNREWIQFYRGDSHEHLNAIVSTVDNGFAFVGVTDSYGEGFNDVWLVKVNAQGKKEWDRTYGGSEVDTAYEVIQLADGSFAIIGATSSFGAGGFDAWLLKTDADGILHWNRTYGRSTHNSAYSGILAADDGFILVGTTKTFRTFTDDMDLWLLKLDGQGELQWNQTYGGDKDDEAYSVIQTADGGFAIAGRTLSYDATNWDAWLVKTDALGITPDIEIPRFTRFELVLIVGLTIIAIVSFVFYVRHWRKWQASRPHRKRP